MSNNKPLDSISSTETVEIENGLSLVSRVKLDLTLFPASPSVTKPVDEWKLKRTLIDYLKTILSVSVVVPEEDLHFRRVKDSKKRKRDDPLALGTLFIRDLGFLDATSKGTALYDDFLEWRTQVVEKMDGIELNIEGFKYRLNVAVPASDDFESMKREWEDFYAMRNRGFSRNVKQEPDTIVLRGVPSRWFAEPRVSSKPSLLVTHTIFSTFGGIKNLNVGEDEYMSKDESEDSADIISGLHCKIVVQFETHKVFYNTLKVLCCRSMKKQGSRLLADYEVSWDRDGIFQNLPSQSLEKGRIREKAPEYHRSEAPRRQQYVSRFNSDDIGRKRFKE